MKRTEKRPTPETAPAAARQILGAQLRLIVTHRQSLLDGTEGEALHDLRVAIRRFRAGIRFFKPLLPDRTRRAANTRLRTLTRELSPIRDSEVWGVAIRRECPATQNDAPANARACHANHVRRHRRMTHRLTTILTTPHTKATLAYCKTLVRNRLRGQSGVSRRASFQRLAGARLRKGLRTLTPFRTFDQTDNPEALHDLRKLTRRLRYWAEFSQYALGKDIASLTLLLKTLSTTMGQIHDTDVFLARIASDKTSPRSLSRRFKAQRKESVKAFNRSWAKLHRRSYRRRIAACIEASRES